MPYMPYSRLIVNPETGKRESKWKLRKIKCRSCFREFTTHNPKKEYCSTACYRKEMSRNRRNKRKAEDKRKAEIIERTKKELGYA